MAGPGKARLSLLALLLATVGLVFWLGSQRLHIETDITAALPKDDQIINAARDILHHHANLESMVVDLAVPDENDDVDKLVEAAGKVEQKLLQSGLVIKSETAQATQAMAWLVPQITDHLPLFFSAQQLSNEVAPLLRPELIRHALNKARAKMFELGGIGQARLLAKDPLGLTGLAMKRLALANPLPGATVQQGFLISPDRRHLLLVLKPKAPPGDTQAALKLNQLMQNLRTELASQQSRGTTPVKLTYAGAFRAALDNETIIRRDTSQALIIVSIGLLILVLCCFRRPWIGALALVPAVAGVMLATFVYSIFQSSIMALAMGFGGALIAVAVDHGLAYVLMLDRGTSTSGRTVSHELWKIASFPVFTTVAALLTLAVSGIPLFKEVGLFAAFGVGLAALFVHLFFPLAFPNLKGSPRNAWVPVGRFMDYIVQRSGWKIMTAAIVVAVILACFIRLDFKVDLNAMNTMTPATSRAEESVARTWGNVFDRVYVMAKADSQKALWDKANRLGGFLLSQKNAGIIKDSLPFMTMLPGPKQQASNLVAWNKFWSPARVKVLRSNLSQAASETGFAPNAFGGFLREAAKPSTSSFKLRSNLFSFLGVTPAAGNSGSWYMVGGVARGPAYQASSFIRQAKAAGFSVFDANFFSAHMGQTLASSFVWMLILIACGVVVLLVLLFLDTALVLTSLAPLSFALVATLGTLGLLGQPLSLSSLMLAPVVLGMGLDYGLYLVRSHQRYGQTSMEQAGPFRITVLLGGVSTLLGMGALVFSEHAVLREAGITTSLGILFALLGAFCLVPPILRFVFRQTDSAPTTAVLGSKDHLRNTFSRFRHIEPHPRLFARFKIACDPMFPRLGDLVKGRTILDVGCGYAVPAAWLLGFNPALRFHSIEPDPERMRVAARVLGAAGEVYQAAAPDLSSLPSEADTALALDMAHYLDDGQLAEMLAGLRTRLQMNGRLVMRITKPKPDSFSWLRWFELKRMHLAGCKPYFRSQDEIKRMLNDAGFDLQICEPCAPGREETWFVCDCATSSSEASS